MCIACRSHDAKRGLFRIVRSPEGEVESDPTGRRNGRGAYLCGQHGCWEKALGSGLLARALNVEIDTETLDRLRRYAATLPLETSTAAGTAAAARVAAAEHAPSPCAAQRRSCANQSLCPRYSPLVSWPSGWRPPGSKSSRS